MPPSRLTREVRDALAVYGYLLLSARQTAKAHEVFKGMRVLFPDDAYVAKGLAVTSLAVGDAQSAVAIADGARSGAETADAEILDLVRGKALAKLGREDEARRLLEAVLAGRASRRPTS
jgi:predicted Zn-dependent protease